MKTYYHILIFLLINAWLNPVSAASNELRERIYLQTDKDLFLAGELIWMKLYLTDAEGIPSSFSKIGYIELLDASSSQLQVKLDLTNGIGNGWMEIPATLPTGYYQLVAYTRQMQNEGEKVFFKKHIGIINTFIIDETLQTDTLLHASMPSVLENNISVTTDKSNLVPRSQNEVTIQGLPENTHSLCISIAGKDIAPITNDINITQWQNGLSSLSNVSLKKEFIPEHEGHIIKGKIVSIDNPESSANEKVSPLLAFVGDQIRMFGGKTDNKSNVLFFTKGIKGMHEVVTATYSPSNIRYRVDIQSPFVNHSEREMPDFKINPDWKEQLLQRSLALQVLHTFTADSLNKTDTTYAHFQWKPDRSYILDEYTRFTTMEEVVIEFIPALRFRKINNRRLLSIITEEGTSYTLGNSLVFVDGIPITDHEYVFRYDPLLVRKIDVYKGKFIFGGQFFDGITFFTTYNLDYPTLKVEETTQFFDYEGTQAHRHFYSPAYIDENDKKSRIPDYRHTLLWIPEIEAKGNTSLSIPFSTSDLTGEFQITVEGLTTDGKVIRGTSFFNVNE